MGCDGYRKVRQSCEIILYTAAVTDSRYIFGDNKMTLYELVKSLQELVNEGNGNLPVYYRHGNSGDCGPVSTPRVSDTFDDMGPFNCPALEYVEIYVGN